MNRLIRSVALLGATAALAACGDASMSAELMAPAPREARVALTPALDLGALTALSDQITIEQIVVSVADARLLGAHPAIPTGGHHLLDGPMLLDSLNGEALFPFPEALLEGGDLAVFLRLAPNPELDGASVVVRGRVHNGAVLDETQRELQGELQQPGPDGEPAHDPRDPKQPGPDGEPAHDPRDPKQPGPDGEPAMPDCPTGICTDKHGLSTSLPFELRGTDAADLLIDLSESSRLNVVLGIPASRWFTPEVVGELDEALSSPDLEEQQTIARAGRIVLEAEPPPAKTAAGEAPAPVQAEEDEELAERGDGAYRLFDEGAFDPTRFRY